MINTTIEPNQSIEPNQFIKVTQISGRIGKPIQQYKNLIGLGLGGKIGKSVTLKDNASVRGMIKKVQHLVAVEPLKQHKN